MAQQKARNLGIYTGRIQHSKRKWETATKGGTNSADKIRDQTFASTQHRKMGKNQAAG
jgi:hypothetical protein